VVTTHRPQEMEAAIILARGLDDTTTTHTSIHQLQFQPSSTNGRSRLRANPDPFTLLQHLQQHKQACLSMATTP
jgi:hypothetical protein